MDIDRIANKRPKEFPEVNFLPPPQKKAKLDGRSVHLIPPGMRNEIYCYSVFKALKEEKITEEQSHILLEDVEMKAETYTNLEVKLYDKYINLTYRHYCCFVYNNIKYMLKNPALISIKEFEENINNYNDSLPVDRKIVSFEEFKKNIALHSAVLDQDEDLMQHLIEFGANINLLDNDGKTPLDLLLTIKPLENIGLSKGMLVANEFLSKLYFSNMSTFQNFVFDTESRNYELMPYMLDNCAKTSFPFHNLFKKLLSASFLVSQETFDVEKNMKALDPIFDQISLFQDTGKDINEPDCSGDSALMIFGRTLQNRVFSNGNEDPNGERKRLINKSIILKLIKMGCDIFQMNKFGECPIVEMLKNKVLLDGEIIEILENSGLPIDPKLGSLLAHYTTNDLEISPLLLYLVEQEIPLDEYDPKGKTFLYNAVQNGNLKLVKFLVMHGADKNKEIQNGERIVNTPFLLSKKNNGSYESNELKLLEKRSEFFKDHAELLNKSCMSLNMISKLLQNLIGLLKAKPDLSSETISLYEIRIDLLKRKSDLFYDRYNLLIKRDVECDSNKLKEDNLRKLTANIIEIHKNSAELNQCTTEMVLQSEFSFEHTQPVNILKYQNKNQLITDLLKSRQNESKSGQFHEQLKNLAKKSEIQKQILNYLSLESTSSTDMEEEVEMSS